MNTARASSNLVCLPFLLRCGLLLACSCVLGLNPAVEAYEAARYPEALASLEELEATSGRWPPADRARYALFRGLTVMALGHRRESQRWLSEAKRYADRAPEGFSADDRGRLEAAWAHAQRSAILDEPGH